MKKSKENIRANTWVGLKISSILVGGIIAFTIGCQPAESNVDDTAAEDSKQAPAARVVNVEALKVQLSDFVDYIRITGEVLAKHDITVSSEESGVIIQYYAEKGSSLKKGDRIAKLKDNVLITQVAEAQATATLAREQFKRQKTLWKKDKIGSELAYLQAKSQSDAATARLNMLKARLANTVVRAPISGTFEGKYLETGEMASPGTPLIRIINTDKVKISGGVPERYAMFIAVGDSAIITFDILPDKEFEGTISFVGGAVDSDNRTFPIEIMLANRERNVKPNMVANIQLVRERRTGVVTVPREVIVRTEYGYQLYVAQEFQGSLIASARWVEMGPAHKNNVIIEAGLDPGELLITLGYQQVDHGTPIRLVNTGEIVLAGEDNQ